MTNRQVLVEGTPVTVLVAAKGATLDDEHVVITLGLRLPLEGRDEYFAMSMAQAQLLRRELDDALVMPVPGPISEADEVLTLDDLT